MHNMYFNYDQRGLSLLLSPSVSATNGQLARPPSSAAYQATEEIAKRGKGVSGLGFVGGECQCKSFACHKNAQNATI